MADEHKVDRDSDTLENLPPEELRKKIEEQKKQIKESFTLAVTALIAIIAVCIAWFASNNQVKLTSSNISASDVINFELATSGDSGVIDTKKKPLSDFIEKIGGIIGNEYSLGNDTDIKSTITSSARSSIQWNMSPEHENFSNVEGSGQFDDMGDENIGLQPGAYGELTFYIVPKIDGAQTVNCTIQLTPYVDKSKKSGLAATADTEIKFSMGEGMQEKEVYEIIDSKVKHVLSGHIYFFMNKENGLYTSWLQPDENGTLHFKVELDTDTKKESPKKVTIYWSWPTLMSQVLLKDGDTYLGSRKQLFDKETQDKIVKFMCSSNPDDSSFFFIASNNETTSVDETIVEKIHNVSWGESQRPLSREEYSGINQLYNNADQFLGKTVSYVSLELSATN